MNSHNAAAAIVALQAKLKAARRAASGETHLVDQVIRATLKFGSVQVCLHPAAALQNVESPIP